MIWYDVVKGGKTMAKRVKANLEFLLVKAEVKGAESWEGV